MIPPATILLATAIGLLLLGAWTAAAALIRRLRIRRRLRMIIEDGEQHARLPAGDCFPWPLANSGPEDRVILGARGGLHSDLIHPPVFPISCGRKNP